MKKVMFVLAILGFTYANANEGGSSIGPGNPSSYNCLKLGGVLEDYELHGGAASNCVIDEWQLYREMDSRGLVNKKPLVGGANPAAVNCVDIKGTIRIVETYEGQQGFCVVDSWQLFSVIDVITKP